VKKCCCATKWHWAALRDKRWRPAVGTANCCCKLLFYDASTRFTQHRMSVFTAASRRIRQRRVCAMSETESERHWWVQTRLYLTYSSMQTALTCSRDRLTTTSKHLGRCVSWLQEENGHLDLSVQIAVEWRRSTITKTRRWIYDGAACTSYVELAALYTIVCQLPRCEICWRAVHDCSAADAAAAAAAGSSQSASLWLTSTSFEWQRDRSAITRTWHSHHCRRWIVAAGWRAVKFGRRLICDDAFCCRFQWLA